MKINADLRQKLRELLIPIVFQIYYQDDESLYYLIESGFTGVNNMSDDELMENLELAGLEDHDLYMEAETEIEMHETLSK